MIRMRYIIIVGLIAVAVFGVTTRVSASYGLEDLQLELSNSTTLADAQCATATIQNAIDRLKSAYVQRFLNDIRSSFAQTLRSMLFRLAACYAGSLIGYGTGPSGSQSCTSDLGGATASQLKQQYLTKLEGDFKANCVARATLDQSFDTARRVIAENGREGGPAFVQDWRDFQAQSSQRGLQISRNQMANTKYCPWVGQDMQGLFNFSADQAVTLTGEYGDAGQSYSTAAACSLPDGFDLYAPQNQTLDALSAVTMPENNIYGSYLMGQENTIGEILSEAQADQNEFVQTGGFGAIRQINPADGTSCSVRAPDGTCLKYSKIVQPGGGVQAEVQAERQAGYDWLNNARTSNSIMGDVRAQIISSLLDFTQPAMRFQYGLDSGGQDQIDNPDNPVEPADGGAGSGGSGGGGGGGGDEDICFDVSADPAFQQMAQGIVQDATKAAKIQYANFVTSDGVSVLPDQNVLFLDGVCHVTLFPVNCHAKAGSNSEIVVMNGAFDFVVDIIAPDNVIRVPGQVMQVCTTGTQ